METRFLNDLELYGAFSMCQLVEEFPANPKVGMFVLKRDGASAGMYGYLRLGGFETWYPFASRTSFYIHTQAVAAINWVVNHGLGTSDVFAQVKDDFGNIINVGKLDIDENSFELRFTTPVTGTVMVVAPTRLNVPSVQASKISVGSDVLIDNTGVRIRGQYVLTEANIAKQIDDAINLKIKQLQGFAPENLDTIEEIAASVQALEVSTQTADGGPY